jgi:hypothetical protein
MDAADYLALLLMTEKGKQLPPELVEAIGEVLAELARLRAAATQRRMP